MPEAFERQLNEVAPLLVLDGYAPFCKLHVHRNWTATRCLTVPITDGNRHLLRSDYDARATSCRCRCAGSRGWNRRWRRT